MPRGGEIGKLAQAIIAAGIVIIALASYPPTRELIEKLIGAIGG